MRFSTVLLSLLVSVAAASAADSDALAISANIQARHLPYGTVLDPIFADSVSDEIVGYTRCGDSAIWTGHYIAAEAYRYRVTSDPGALDSVKRAILGVQRLIDVTGTDLLARCYVPVDSPYASGIVQEEAANGVHIGSLDGQGYFWIGNTSRDQYSGVFFGLAVAYDLIDDAAVRDPARALLTRMLDFLNRHHWAVVMPGGSVSTVFAGRMDQQLSFLQVGRHVNSKYSSSYRWTSLWQAPLVTAPIGIDVLDVYDSYFKFNLDTINLYNLIRLEDNGYRRTFYKEAYKVLRRTTDNHGNAHFNMIDRALNGPDPQRDAETVALLNAWLKRPRRDPYVDLRGVVPACGNDRACDPIPVELRVPTDFLWQRSPFQLMGGGSGRVESAGIDYILPYWMARFYGVL